MSNDSEDREIINYSFKVGENLHKKVEKIIHLLNIVDQDEKHSKQKWIVEAIQEKLEQEVGNFPEGEIPKERQLTVRINKVLNEKIQRRVDLVKQHRDFYSKKQWLLEALYEKLDRDQDVTKKMLKDLAEK